MEICKQQSEIIMRNLPAIFFYTFFFVIVIKESLNIYMSREREIKMVEEEIEGTDGGVAALPYGSLRRLRSRRLNSFRMPAAMLTTASHLIDLPACS